MDFIFINVFFIIVVFGGERLKEDVIWRIMCKFLKFEFRSDKRIFICILLVEVSFLVRFNFREGKCSFIGVCKLNWS